ncbi:Rv1157c family protein [Corynebacterium guangdongense]|uniref:Secreted protein n=1 Tax=Corynebacterium guangdongense TaxID=1783348 RepID=A0ABU1ZVQ0_9CORY|nr:hypothetical protein [Corynebacterium guangdongense]MDR7329012.1 hypothetical protein [Corynebacterium guangdongense]WJZ17582.1 hypothetical protein CGUA_04985 [Corynebacterium guangdongense]
MTHRRLPHPRPLTARVAVGAASALLALTATLGAPAASAQSADPLQVVSSSAAQAASPYVDGLGRPSQYTQDRVREFAAQPWIPKDLRSAILTALNFYAGNNGDGGPDMPSNAPTFTQFYWPTVSGGCINGQLDSVGSALAVPGPAEIPAPGAADGQTAFLFTALGTSPAAPVEVPQNMRVHWFNIDTLTSGVTPLTNHGINPEGPATLSGVGDTGHGTILALLEGDVVTTDATCSFVPTVTIIEAP